MDSAKYFSFKEFKDTLRDKGKFELPGSTISLGIDSHMNVLLKNCENNPEQNSTEDRFYADQYPYKYSAEHDEPLHYTSFLYGKGNDKIFAVDPDNLDMWQIDSKQSGYRIRIRKLTRNFIDEGSVSGIENITLKIKSSEFVGIYGGSGVGKTTFLEKILAPARHKKSWIVRLLQTSTSYRKIRQRSANSLRKHDFGAVRIDGKNPSVCVGSMAYLPQKVDFPENLTCRKIFSLVMADRGISRHDQKIKILQETMRLCVIDDSILNKKYSKLSGGQKRRIALCATLLRNNIRLLIVDEPTTGLDLVSETEIIKTLRRVSRYGITVIAVTHAPGACRYFDRVLVLQKKDPKNAATLGFNGLFNRELLKSGNVDFDKLSDAQILSRMIVGEKFPPQNDLIWCFDKFSESQKDSDLKRKIPFKNHLRILLDQWGHWTAAGFSMILKDKRGLGIFIVLSLLCIFAIQIGVQADQNRKPEIMLVTLIALAAPWLCATYSAIFSAKLLKFYAWENFSGLKAVSYVRGLFTALIVPAVILAFVFSVGLYLAPNSSKIADFIIPYQYLLKKDDYVNNKLDLQYSNGFQPAGDIKNRFGSETLDGFKHIDLMNKSKSISSQIDKTRHVLGKYLSNIPSFILVWFALSIICLVGNSLGLMMTALFRDAKNSTLALVVLFVIYLLFSRLLLEEKLMGLMETIGSDACRLEITERGCILPILLSFCCLGRYAANVILECFSIEQFGLSADFLVLLLFMIISLIATCFLYSGRNKNWRLLSR